MKIPRTQLPPVLPDELIVEILSWLLVKPLQRLQCVRKSWKSLIFDPYFLKLHLRRSPKNANLILTLDYNERDICAVSCSVRSLLEDPSSPISEDGCYRLKDKYWVCGSCNGLVCLLSYRHRNFGNPSKEYWVRLWNPATRLRSKKWPCFPVNWSIHNATTFGFGYDSSSDTYKVVAVLWDRKAKEDSQKTQVKVYNMRDNCWKNIQSFPALPLENLNDGVYLNGTLNWLAVLNTSSGIHKWDTVTIDQLVIVSLDLGKETNKQLLLPDGLDEVPHVEPNLGLLSECLCLFHDYKRTHFVVWQMKEFGVEKSWTQFVNVSYQHLQIEKHWTSPYSSPEPLCVSENGDVLMLLNNDDLVTILFNRRDNSVKLTKIPNDITWTSPKEYVQSLVLPCGN